MNTHFQNPAVIRRAPRAAGVTSWPAGILPIALAVLGGLLAFDGPNGSKLHADQPDRPSFIHRAPGDVLPVPVREIVSTEVADLVLIHAGYHSGYRPGMICRVIRDEIEVAEIMMVEVRNGVSAGVIVNIFTDEVIERGDVVRVKTTQYQR